MLRNSFRIILILIGYAWLAFSCQPTLSNENTEKVEETTTRIISLSGFLTEVLVELGHGGLLVGRDVTSTTPKNIVEKIPNLGHVSQLNAEAVLALKPTHLFVEKSQIQQSNVFDQLKSTGINIVTIPTTTHLYNSIQAAKLINEYLPTNKQKVDQLTNQIKSDSLRLADKLSGVVIQPQVLFIYARGAGRLMVAGRNTAAAAIINKAGGQNAIQSFEGFKAMTPEALLEAAPDVILMFESGLASLDGKEGLAQITGVSQTPAFKNNRIIAMDGHYLTAFGPKVGQAALDLANEIHPAQ